LAKSATAGSNYEYKDEKYKSPAGILLHSRTAVEKDGFVSTGILSYAEGDILEVEMPEYKAFQLGDSVKVTVYSPGGVYTFNSTVVAKDHGALMIINPPHNQRRFVEKREQPRIQLDEKGVIHTVRRLHENEKQRLNKEVDVTVRNISISGIGFVLNDNALDLSDAEIETELDVGFKLPFTAEIVRREPYQAGIYYGAKFVNMDSGKANSIRAFVLKKQVEFYFKEKKLTVERRKYK